MFWNLIYVNGRRKKNDSRPTGLSAVDTYSVQERLYVLEYRSPTEGGKGGDRRGGQFLR